MSSPLIIKTPAEFQSYRSSLPSELKNSVGFVPTMGALHSGHAELLKRCRTENKLSVLSIYVNQTQFNDPKDFEKYPQTLNADLEIASNCGVDVVFNPSFEAMYPDSYTYKISESILSQSLCGASRPGHFDGVLTVVMKLLNIVEPQRAYFGEKDFQQLTLIEGLVKAFFLKSQIVRVATQRESSGLALSSRNTRLSAEGLVKASEIYKSMTTCKTTNDVTNNLKSLGFDVDYVEDKPISPSETRRFVAAFLEGVRLIDNTRI